MGGGLGKAEVDHPGWGGILRPHLAAAEADGVLFSQWGGRAAIINVPSVDFPRPNKAWIIRPVRIDHVLAEKPSRLTPPGAVGAHPGARGAWLDGAPPASGSALCFRAPPDAAHWHLSAKPAGGHLGEGPPAPARMTR